MSEHVGYIVKITELHPHSNADRLQCATIFSQNVIVGLDVQLGDIGVFFPSDLQLSLEYCDYNHLCRKDAEWKPDKGYLEREKRNIKAMKLRGERSEGLFMPLESFAYTGVTKFEVGDKIDTLNGHEICRKYIPRGNSYSKSQKLGNKTRKRRVPLAPLFAEHVDTEQLVYNLGVFKPGDLIEITLKMHGTSGRTGYLPKFVGYKKNIFEKIFKRPGKPIYEYGYVTGTRRVVLNDFEDGGFYGTNDFRAPHAQVFEGKLHKGETVYYELVGFTTNGIPIMPAVANSKIADKEFTKKYGPQTIFSYGCDPKGEKTISYWDKENTDPAVIKTVPQSDMYVYRMTYTSEDGYVIEYTPDFMRFRCEQMGVKTVPVLWRGYLDEPDDWTKEVFNPGEFVKQIAEEFYEGPDPVGKTHIREGVVVRIVNKPKFCAFKHKNFQFKVLEGIAKDIAKAPDMEEQQETIEEVF